MRRGSIALCAALMLVAAAPGAQIEPEFVAAKLTAGSVPPLPPPNVVGWIDDVVEVLVDETGAAKSVSWIQRTPLPQDILTPVISTWRFRPATLDKRDVPARVVVSAIFRPPVQFNNPTPGNPPEYRGTLSPEVPFPQMAIRPSYPPHGVTDGVVLLEVRVGDDGRVRDVSPVAGGGALGDAAIDAVKRWVFRPAVKDGRRVETFAYVIVGFRRPLAQ